MVTLDNAITARLKHSGKHFEVLVDPELALRSRKGDDVDISAMLAVEDVFENASRGDHPSKEDVEKTFETTDIHAIAEHIVKHGELHLTKEQRKQLIEDKRRQVVSVIASGAFNPQTKAPHPPSRIEKAMEEAGVHIDPMKSIDELVKTTMKAIRPIIPIRFDTVEIAVKIPADYAAKSYGEVVGFGEVLKEEWQADGSWIGVVKIPAGMQLDFYGLVNRISKGSAETKFLR
ncbi:ribosome assembly factor SBDS [ANME-2 cluster archaeon]|nr:MAG: ribosome assembly factor SBDS [ANME-2 cluster archaeon]RLG19480.1 MAG: ribosome assembly factor SBDS [Methanosarcinales archaeon]